MLRGGVGELDYFKLLKSAKRLDPSKAPRTMRLAVLGDCATQQFSTLIRVLGHRQGINTEIYDAGFDTIETEIFNPASPLYAFKPDVVILLNTVNALKARFLGQPVDRSAFASATLERMTGLWRALRQNCSALIIQSNFVAPYERAFGNFDHRVDGSLTDAVQAINRGLSEQCRSHKDVFLNDVESLASYLGRGRWFDEKLWVLAKSPCALDVLPRLAQNVVDIAAASVGAAVKCVVLDLDNTLWGGVIGDDGLDGIRLGHVGDGEAYVAFQNFLKELQRRGVLLAVCSKNDAENAVKPFREHPDMVLKEDDITVFLANWENKAQNIQTIRNTLNIGFDAMVFLDDSAFERNLVRDMLPEVIVPELPEDAADYVKAISELNLFEVASYSELDRERAALYAVEARRDGLKGTFANIDDYLKSLEMKLTLGRFDPFNLPRIAQLIQRSNQFNLATRRYNEAQCEAMMRDVEGYFPIQVSLRDRFGDYGLISVVVLRHHDEDLFIEEYLMSCRVLQRGVEQFVMNAIFEYGRKRGARTVRGSFRPTPKNGMVTDFYSRFGFEKEGTDEEGNTSWFMAIDRFLPSPTHIEAVAFPEEIRGGRA